MRQCSPWAATPASAISSLRLPAARRRQALFALWCVGLVVVADLISFYVAVVGGLAILFVAIRLRPIPAVAIIAGSVLALWGLFDQFLGVRF